MITGVIFCDSDNLIARGIKDITGDEESHCALLFDDNVVLHYRFLGFETMLLSEFEAIYQISALLAPPQAIFCSPDIVVKKHNGGAYDFLGMIYVGLHLLVSQFFGVNLPNINRWETRRKRFCVEFVAETVAAQSGSLMTPHQLYSVLKSRGWNEVQ
jgi:hypothetical protein